MNQPESAIAESTFDGTIVTNPDQSVKGSTQNSFNSPHRYRFSYNPRVHNKPRTEAEKRRVGYGWKQAYLDLEGLKGIIRSGHAINTALLAAGHRTDAGFVSGRLVVVDVDNSITIEGITRYNQGGDLTIEAALALAWVQRFGLLGYTTPSHGKADPLAPGGVHDKFRIIFAAPFDIEDIEVFRQLIRLVLAQIPGADPATVSGTNAFYGNTDAWFFLENSEAEMLPVGLVEQARANVEAAREAAATAERSRLTSDGLTAAKVLSLIPNNDATVPDWDRYRNVLFAAFNAGCPEDEARAWSESNPKHTAQGFTDVWGPKPLLDTRRMLGLEYLLRQVKGRFFVVPDDFEFSSDVVQGLPERQVEAWDELKDLAPTDLAQALQRSNLVVEYTNSEDLLAVLDAAVASGIQVILVNSGTGSGKTYQIAQRLSSKQGFGTEPLTHAYITVDKYNPSDVTLKTLDAVPSHHHGLVHERLPDGRTRTRLATDPSEANTKATCKVPEAFNRAGELGIEVPTTLTESGSEVSMICAGCKVPRNHCPAITGKRIALGGDFFRIHPAQLPEPKVSTDLPGGFDYGEALGVAEEIDQFSFVDRRLVTRTQLEASLCDLEESSVELPVAWHEFFYGTLRNEVLVAGGAGRYGLSQRELIELLPIDTPRVDTAPLWDIVGDSNADAFDGLYTGVWQGTTGEETVDRTALAQNLARLKPRNVVLQLLDILQGNGGAVRVSSDDTLEITERNDVGSKLARFKHLVGLSATVTPTDLSTYLGVAEDQILVVRMAPKLGAAVDSAIITDMGRMTSDRSEDANYRLGVILPAIKASHGGKLAVASYKAAYKANPEIYDVADYTLTHGVDTIGSNEAQDARVLVSDGVYVQNLGASQAEYTALTGNTPVEGTQVVFYRQPCEGLPPGQAMCWVGIEAADNGLRLYNRRKVVTAQVQTYGRLRANLRAGETLFTYHTASYPVPYPCRLLESSEITPDAASRGQRTLAQVIDAIAQLANQGLKLTQSAIAELAGVSQSHISKLLTDLSRGWRQRSLPRWIAQGVEALLSIPSAFIYIKGLGIMPNPSNSKVSSRFQRRQNQGPKSPISEVQNNLGITPNEVSHQVPQGDSSMLLATQPTLTNPQLSIFAELSLEPEHQSTQDYIILNPADPSYQAHLLALDTCEGLVALDTETFGLNPKAKTGGLDPINGRVRLIQLATPTQVYLVDLGSRDADRAAIYAAQQPFFSVLRRLMARAVIVGHNLSFDLRFLRYQYDLRATRVSDTFVGARVFYGDYGSKGSSPVLAGGYSLANLAQQLLGRTLDKADQKRDWGAALDATALSYAATDARVTLDLQRKLVELYNDTKHPFYNAQTSSLLMGGWKLENSVIPKFIEVEHTGVPVNGDALADLFERADQVQAELMAQWDTLLPGVNPWSPQQLAKALGLPSTGASILQDNYDKHPAIPVLLQLRAIKNYRDDLEYFDQSSNALGDGRARTMFKSLDGTGRSASGGADVNRGLFNNLQNILASVPAPLAPFELPKVRSVVQPPNGMTMAVIDLAAAHARIAAGLANDTLAIAAYNDPTIDTHSQVAVYVAKAKGLNWTADHINAARKDKDHPDHTQAKTFRDIAKTTFYSWLNGAGANRVQSQLLVDTGISASIDDCKEALNGCKALFPGINALIRNSLRTMNANPVSFNGRAFGVNNTSDGFRLVLEMLPNHDDKLEVPYNAAIASTWSRIEATAMKRALVAVSALAESNPEWGLEIWNYVHDEIDVLCKQEFASSALPAVNDAIGDAFAGVLANGCSDGRETNWERLVVRSWAEK